MSCLKKTLAVLLFSWVVLLPAAQAAEPQPVEVFSRLPQFYGVSMSPDGQRFAMERNSADGDLAVRDDACSEPNTALEDVGEHGEVGKVRD